MQTRPGTGSAAHVLLRPFQSFFKLEAASGILLLAMAVLALLWANTPLADRYFALRDTPITVAVGDFALSKPLLLWINDALMAVFFFVVGLELKREVLVGELSAPRKAALPVAAATGGMLLPAGLYLLLNAREPGARGWGIPMATDIAFALGVLALLGRRVPPSLKVFLTAVAIVDDLGALLVIALFYTANLSWLSLGGAGLFLAALIVANQLGVRRTPVYGLLGIGLWVALLKSGLHATIAGVLVAMTIPARQRIDASDFAERSRRLLDEFATDRRAGVTELTENQRDAIQSLEVAARDVEAPLTRLEHALHPSVAFGIVPLFGLANAGVALGGQSGAAPTNPITLGVALGLFVGKQLGVTAFAWLSVRLGLAVLPAGVGWRQLYGVSLLCGIGFTMSLFIASLAFGQSAMLDSAKVGILIGSLVSGLSGWFLLARMAPARR